MHPVRGGATDRSPGAVDALRSVGAFAREHRDDLLLGVLVLAAVTAALAADVGGGRTPDAVAYLFAVGLAALMLVRRSFPVLALAATAVGIIAYYAAGYPSIGLAVPAAGALYSAAEAGRTRYAVATAVGLLLVSTAARVVEGESVGYLLGYEFASTAGLMAAAITLGDSVRSRRLWREEQRRSAERAVTERRREATWQRQQERMRIARDLHDSLAHTASVISLHTHVAEESLLDEPDAARTALGHVRAATTQAIRELRSTVGLLRATPDDPPPELGGRLAEVVAATVASGLPVDVQGGGAARTPGAGRGDDRLPDRAGVTDQCRAPRLSALGGGRAELLGDRAPHPGHRRRPSGGPGECRGRSRNRRHAGTSPLGRRLVHGRTARRGRIPGRGDAPAGPIVIRVAVVDDQHLVRAGLRVLLERAEDIVVVGEAGDGANGVALVQRERPDVVLMDIRMPGTDGLEATRAIVNGESTREVRVIALTMFDSDEHVFAAIRAGVSGFLLKDADPDALRHAVRVVASGGALLATTVTRRVMDAAASRVRPIDVARLDALTKRERDVLIEVAAGLPNDEVARALHLSPATVRTYVSRLFGKLEVTSRSQLVVIAYETGLAAPGGR